MAKVDEYELKEKTLEETAMWAVAVVCFVLLVISIGIEKSIHKIGTWLKQKKKKTLYEALEKVKAELMLLGFISLLLTVGQTTISGICIPMKPATSMRPCSATEYHPDGTKMDSTTNPKVDYYLNGTKVEYYPNDTKVEYYPNGTKVDYYPNGTKVEYYPISTKVEYYPNGTKIKKDDGEKSGRRLLHDLAESYIPRRSLATKGYDKCTKKGKVAFVSAYGIHQLHVFIFVLAVVHVIYCIVTYALGKTKMRIWKKWEDEAQSLEHRYSNDPERFRFARETTFGRRHLTFWSKTSVTLWIVCFFRQFFGSVTKVDYLALRRGFIMKHFSSGTEPTYDFRKYIQRSLEKDYKEVVEIKPVIWFFTVLLLLTNTNGLQAYLWVPFIPLLIVLVVGTKLQVTITRLALRIQEKGDVVRGAPMVQPGDDLFWFDSPRFNLDLIHLVLFTNAFQLAFFVWTSLAFELKNCFHQKTADVVIRIVVGVVVEILCSYVTLPLYALVTQMGTNLKLEVFDEKVATAIKKWHHTAKEPKHGRHSESNSSRPTTPTHGSSPNHLLRNHNNRSGESDHHGHHNFWDPESQHQEAESSTHHSISEERSEHSKPVLASVELPPIKTTESSKKFSFKKSDS